MCNIVRKRWDLFRGTNPAELYACQIQDPACVEDWVQSPDARDPFKPEANWCAMCCTQMILRAEGVSPPPLLELFEQAISFSVYRQEEARIGWRGAYHRELADYLGTKWRMRSSAERNMSPEWVCRMLSYGNYCLLSVHPEIRLRADIPPPHKNGHFVLIYGYNTTEEGEIYFLLQNTAGFASQESQVGMAISAHRLEQVFSGNGIVVQSRFAHLSMLRAA